MKIEHATATLEEHNEWRRGADIPQLKPEIVGLAIDKAIEVMKRNTWIDINKQQPEPGVRVIAMLSTVGILIIKRPEEGQPLFMYKDVTHWMPLPEEPEND